MTDTIASQDARADAGPAADVRPLPGGAQWRSRIRAKVYEMLQGLVPSDSAIAMAQTDARIDAAHFEEAVCRNCGMVRTEPHCGGCGQKAVSRLDVRDVVAEFWQAYRLFEASMVKACLSMVKAPGRIAREYVLGARKRHVHPLKLLLFAAGFQILLLAKTRYLEGGVDQLSAGQVATLKPIMEQIAALGRWAFTMTLPAIWLASWAVYRKRLGYNAVEHLVLAVYTMFLISAANVLNLLPLLALDAPRWVQWHRSHASWYMDAVEVAIVALAFSQFHRLRLPQALPRLLLALAVFYLAKEGLLRVFARGIYHYVIQRNS